MTTLDKMKQLQMLFNELQSDGVIAVQNDYVHIKGQAFGRMVVSAPKETVTVRALTSTSLHVETVLDGQKIIAVVGWGGW